MTVPSFLNTGLRLASASTVLPGRGPSSTVDRGALLDHRAVRSGQPVLDLHRHDLVVEGAVVDGRESTALALGRQGVLLSAG